MAYNIYSYTRFARQVRDRGGWAKESRFLKIPIMLLVLFLAGYLAVGAFGQPDPVVAWILFGGSVFVLVMLLLVQRAVDRIQEDEHLQARLSAAEEASRAKTFFLSNMSHDIRTPLNAIIGYATLANDPGTTTEMKTGYIDKIQRASRQLLDIVNDVLEMSRIESGKIELEPVRVDLENCVCEAGDLVRNQMTEKGIRFTVSCGIENRWVLCDRNLLNRALMNLLCNAAKFTPQGGEVSLTMEELPGDDSMGRYEIRVKDTGIGMSPEFVEHLFTPFERERTSTVSKIQGTGLGMAITKSIIDLMNGEIEVITRKDEGTEFVVALTLPIEPPAEAGQPVSTREVRFDGLRALLVEDNAINMEIACMLLSQTGLQVDTAENGQIALDRVKQAAPGTYDIILMDVQMPVMDGYTATRAIRALPDPDRASVPIVAMTANAFQDDIEASRQAGMNAHIAKPLDVENMISTLAEVLKGRTDAI